MIKALEVVISLYQIWPMYLAVFAIYTYQCYLGFFGMSLKDILIRAAAMTSAVFLVAVVSITALRYYTGT